MFIYMYVYINQSINQSKHISIVAYVASESEAQLQIYIDL